MKYRAIRKLTKNGHSYTVAIPREFCENMRLLRGVDMEIIYDDEHDAIIVRAKNAPPRTLQAIRSGRGVRLMTTLEAATAAPERVREDSRELPLLT